MLINKNLQLFLKYFGLYFQSDRILQSIRQKLFVLINPGHYPKYFGVKGERKAIEYNGKGDYVGCACVCVCEISKLSGKGLNFFRNPSCPFKYSIRIR